MTIVTKTDTISKDAWVELIKADSNKIELLVNFNGAETKRIFVKRDNFWYSELNYEYKKVNGTGQLNDKIYQKYYIYKDHLIKESVSTNSGNHISYLDLNEKEIYHFFGVVYDDKFNIDELKRTEYSKSVFLNIDDQLHEQIMSFEHSRTAKGTTTEILNSPGNNIFFLLDLEEYEIGDDNPGYIQILPNSLELDKA